MKHILSIFLLGVLCLNCYSQTNISISSLTFRQLCLRQDHHMPKLYIMREVSDFRNSNADSICLLTDITSFDKLAKFILESNTNINFNKETKYKYGAYEIIMSKNEEKVLSFVLDDKIISNDFFKRINEFIRLNNIDGNISKKISSITPY